MRPRTKKILFLSLKIIVSGLLLAFVLNKAGLQNIVVHFKALNPWYFLLASLLYIFLIFLASVRWGLLLGGRYPVKRLFSLYLIGSFFNHFLPGSVGGDAVKAYYLYQDTRRGGSSLGSVFLDRYIGFFALLTIGLVSGIAAFNDLEAVGMHWITPSLFALFLVGSLMVFGMRIGRRFSAIADFYDYFHDTIGKKPVVLKAFLLSIALQLSTILIIFLIARGIGQRPPFIALFVFIPIIITVMSVPLSISGLGIREGAFVVLFGLTGISPEASTSIAFLWFLSIVTGSLTGLVEYLRHKR